LYNTNWPLIAKRCGVSDILDASHHKRVTKAQDWGNPDYPDAIARFLEEVFDVDEQIGLHLVHEIASQENPYDDPLSQEAKNELNQILAMFGGQEIKIQSLVRNLEPSEDYVSVTWMPDDFYKKLINEINSPL
jgi:hypothetical protein